MRKEYGALVVGAGIGGIRAALDLAVSGQRVALIDSRPSTGGILNQLDHQFPSDHCGMCKMLPLMNRDASSQFCLRKGLFHENIDIHLSTELVSLEGDPGSFHATLNRRSPLVDPSKCVSCGICAQVCPVRVPSEFNAGLSERGAVYLPVPHAIPNHYVVDLDNCAR
ncbi:MAG: 4Fe-4S binding protein, partial [Proteobacteria bacterium]|nr:4Fe-4S binding protein [Pseudomonadota bacterium]MBU1611527.1 4Fe-4S binding protein [Pseudomonadota bacterium]